MEQQPWVVQGMRGMPVMRDWLHRVWFGDVEGVVIRVTAYYADVQQCT